MFLSPYCCMLNGEAANINFIIFGLIWPWIESTINLLHSRWIFWWLQNQVVTRKNCFRYLKLMSPINKWYYLKNYYLTLRSKGQGSTKVIMVRDTPPYGHAPTYQISLTYLERQKSYGLDKLCWEEAEEAEEKIRLKQYAPLHSKGRHN